MLCADTNKVGCLNFLLGQWEANGKQGQVSLYLALGPLRGEGNEQSKCGQQ